LQKDSGSAAENSGDGEKEEEKADVEEKKEEDKEEVAEKEKTTEVETKSVDETKVTEDSTSSPSIAAIDATAGNETSPTKAE